MRRWDWDNAGTWMSGLIVGLGLVEMGWPLEHILLVGIPIAALGAWLRKAPAQQKESGSHTL